MTKSDKKSWARRLRQTARKIDAEIKRGFTDEPYASAAERRSCAVTCKMEALSQAERIEESL